MEFDPLSWSLIKDHYFRRVHQYPDGSVQGYDLRDVETKLMILHNEWAYDLLEQGYDPDEWTYEREQEHYFESQAEGSRNNPIIIN